MKKLGLVLQVLFLVSCGSDDVSMTAPVDAVEDGVIGSSSITVPLIMVWPAATRARGLI